MNKAAMARATRIPLKRFARIHEFINQDNYPTIEQIAMDLEVSTKVIEHDIAFMRDQWLFPIEFDKHQNGYFYTEAPKQVLGFEVTPSELRLLMIAQRSLGHQKGTPFPGELLEFLGKLMTEPGEAAEAARNLDSAVSFRPMAREIFHPYTSNTLKTAVEQRRGLRFTYRAPGTVKEISYGGHPYHACCINNVWYLLIFLPEEQRIEKFIAHRLRDLAMTDETFERPKDFNPDDCFRGAFLVETGTGDYEVVLDLDRYATDITYYRDLPDLGGESMDLPEGCSRVTFRLSTLNEIERWIRHFGLSVTVVAPQELRDRMFRTGQGYVERYGVAEEKR